MTKVVRNRRKADHVAQHRKAGSGQRGQVTSGKHPVPKSTTDSRLPMLRTSERGVFKRCHRKWALEYLLQLKPRQTSAPFYLGSLVHAALADYYIVGKKRNGHPINHFARHVLEWSAKTEGEPPDDYRDHIDLGSAMLGNYIEHYGADDEWEVLVTEHPFRVIVNHPRDGITPWFWYVGVIDALMRRRRDKKVFIWDHKTAAAIQTRYLALDDQSTSYWTFGAQSLYNSRLIQPGQKIDGMIFNILRKQKPDERPSKIEMTDRGPRKFHLNKDGSVSAKQPAPYFHREVVYRDPAERESARRRVQFEFSDMSDFRKEPDAAYPNFGQWTCPGCPWFGYCETLETGRDAAEYLSLTSQKWNSYDEHEIYIAETK